MNSSGKNKMSFELDFKGGKIWCEHLDSMGSHEDEVIEKFQKDSVTFQTFDYFFHDYQPSEYRSYAQNCGMYIRHNYRRQKEIYENILSRC